MLFSEQPSYRSKIKDNLTETGGGSFRPRQDNTLSTDEQTGRVKGIPASLPKYFDKHEKYEPLPMSNTRTVVSADKGREDTGEHALPYETIIDHQRIRGKVDMTHGPNYSTKYLGFHWEGRTDDEQNDYLHKRKYFRTQLKDLPRHLGLRGGEGIGGHPFG